VLIPFFAGRRATKVLCGYDHSFVFTEDGQIFSFGKNVHSQCGLQTMDEKVGTPTPLGFGFAVTQIAPGNTHTFVLDDKNQVWGVGYMTKDLDFGQVPTLLHSFKEQVQSLQSGGFHCNVLTVGGKVFSFGQNGYKQVGLNQAGTIKTFQQISLPVNGAIATIATGYHHSLALTGDGKLVSWGAQSHGQLGTGVKANFQLPTVLASQQRFTNLYLAQGGVGSGGIVEEEVVEESISLGVNKDVLIKQLQAKVAEQSRTIQQLEAELQSLRIQHQQGTNKVPTMQLGQGNMNIQFTK